MTLGYIADLVDRGDVTFHRVDRLETDEPLPIPINHVQEPLEILHIVMVEDVLLDAAVPDPFDHRGVVELIREDDAVREQLRDRADRGLVGIVA